MGIRVRIHVENETECPYCGSNNIFFIHEKKWFCNEC